MALSVPVKASILNSSLFFRWLNLVRLSFQHNIEYSVYFHSQCIYVRTYVHVTKHMKMYTGVAAKVEMDAGCVKVSEPFMCMIILLSLVWG